MPACRYCQKERAETDFYPTGKSRKDGSRYRSRRCRQCTLGNENIRPTNPREFSGPVGTMLRRARERAVARGLEFSLTPEDVPVPSHCPVLGISMTFGSKDRNNSASLDRIDPKKGYTPDNVRVISFRANRIKCDATVAEIEAILAYMKNP